MNFYNVKKRKLVEIPESQIKKTTYKDRGNQLRYAVRATDDDGTKLTKFVSKETWDDLSVPEE